MANEVDLLTGRVVSHPTRTDASATNMPCIFQNQSHPLTPPEYQYNSGCFPVSQHPHVLGAQAFPEKGVYEINCDVYGRKMAPSFIRSMPPHQQHVQQHYNNMFTGHSGPPGITHPGNHYGQYAPVGQRGRVAPPPMVEDYSRQHQVRQQPEIPVEQPVVEEKPPTGGVSAHLDYEMDEMTDFVGNVAQQLVLGGYRPTENLLPSYRKFVYQILSSTRLPSSTILLGLAYLKERMDIINRGPAAEQNVYRLLTISLLLASKFLDDNTFQNKSWSEVTNIPVTELNALEKEWLRAINWNLHIDPKGDKGFKRYKEMWDSWVRKKAAPPALAPIDTNLRRPSHASIQNHYQVFTPPHSAIMSDRSLPQFQLPPPRAVQQSNEAPVYGWEFHYRGDYSPPSAPETGPTTPEGHFGWSAASVPYSMHTGHQQSNFSRLPPIAAYNHNGWHQHHPSAANCYQCRMQSTEQFFNNTNYGQPIAA
jgi:hypothetical protein